MHRACVVLVAITSQEGEARRYGRPALLQQAHLSEKGVRLAQKISQSVHAFLWEYSYQRLKLA
jgi:hypothetical protein